MDEENVIKQGSGLRKTILILSANPKTTSRLRLDEEVREIEEGLQRAKHRSRFEIRSKWAVRLRDFRRALLDEVPQIVHFTGHGEKEGLFLEDEMGFGVLFSANALTELFKLCSKHVECVILSACYSAEQAAAISEHIDYVIGMQREINDKAAIEFAVGFYDALGAGRSIGDAFEFGRNAVRTEFPKLPEHLIPILKKKEKSEDPGSGEDFPGSISTTQDIFRAALQAHNGKYVSVAGRSGKFAAVSSSIKEAEIFTIFELPDSKVRLQLENGQYVSAENGGEGALIAGTPPFQELEGFEMIVLEHDKIALRTSNKGHFVSAESGAEHELFANRPKIRAWEIFKLTKL